VAEESKTNLRVGLFLLVAAALLGGFLIILGNFSFGSGFRITLHFGYSGNLQTGAPVKLSGIKVGKVESVRFVGGELDPITNKRVYVAATLWVEERARKAIRKNASFYVNTQGVLGEQYLEIQPGTFDQPELDVSRPVEGTDPPRTDLIIARLYEFLDSVTSVLRDDKDLIRDFLKSGASVVRTLDKLLVANQDEIGRLLGDVDGLAKQASSLLAAARSGVGDGNKLKATLDNVEALTAAVRRDLEPLIAKAQKALDGVSSLTGAVDREKLQKALDDLIALGGKADRIAADAQAIVSGVRQGKGTAGALIVEPQIYDDLKELVRDLKRNPWKFFWKE
jgi:phospholipid/cholesterol/gamma-HCH transport system substrate-binding protein